MPADFCRTLDDPVGCFLFFKTTFVADPFLHFTPLIFSCSNTKYFIAAIPYCRLAAALRTIAMCIHGFQKPYAIFKTESAVGQCTYGTDINNITDEIVVERFLNIGSDFRMFTAIQYTVLAFISELIGYKHTTKT